MSSVVKNALTVADQETEIALGDLSVLTVMNTALAEKYSDIADQVAAAASASVELHSQNQKVADFVCEVDALHTELERLESSARELDTFSIQLETAFRQAASKAK